MSLKNHPSNPSAQPFNITGKPSKKRTWSKVRGHNNLKKQGD